MDINKINKIQATICSTEDELSTALVNEDPVIIIRGKLYDDVLPQIKVSKTAKFGKKAGKLSLFGQVTSLVFGGPFSWFLAGVTALSYTVLKKTDPKSLEKYEIRIKKEEQKIYLLKSKGANKFNPKTSYIVE